MEWYLKVLRQYVEFGGRAQRKEYWMFQLFNLLAMIAMRLLGELFGGESGGEGLSGLYSLAVFLPSLGVTVRRLHDIGKSGWWVLLGFIPLVGVLVLLFFLVKDSEAGSNAYGPNPKGLPAVV
ncbi:DUF805 domain-containing protein [Zoogloea sp.]|uniref:DUF805 domain-containing protein n=1 Tax=Zoogloea sp. TaxID=49181 RepID=UPI0035B048AD